MSRQVFLSRQSKDEIHSHALYEMPYECCGFLAGKYSNHVLQTYKLHNIHKNSAKFRISDQEFQSVGSKVLSDGFSILGIYHSHPYGSPCISETDIKGMTFDGIAIVVGLGGEQEMSAYEISGERAHQLKLIVR